MERYDIPYARPGQVIGLFGGSFDPPHKGHVHVTLEAMKAFGLDRVWWLVSPGNPLKERGPQYSRCSFGPVQRFVGSRCT